jgi:hypothetical protein
VQDYVVTDAAVHDSQVFAALLDQTSQEDGNKRAVYADSAYRSQEHEAKLAGDNLPSWICEKGTRGHPLTDAQKESNRIKETGISQTQLRILPVYPHALREMQILEVPLSVSRSIWMRYAARWSVTQDYRPLGFTLRFLKPKLCLVYLNKSF